MRAKNHTSRYDGEPVRAGDELPGALPYPNGWFCLGLSSEWAPGSVHTRVLAGEEVVIYRTRGGTLRATRPYCPHLGAHLGAGGTVEGEYLTCPFHRFSYDVDGTCAHTPYGSPPKATLDLLPVREVYGIVWVWRHHDGTSPTWELPELPATGSHPPVFHMIDLAGYPQDVVENGVDYGHLTELHNFGLERELAAPVAEGPFYQVNFRLKRRIVPLIAIAHDLHLWAIGLAGYYTPVSVPRIGFRIVYWILCTPTAPGRMRITCVITSELTKPRWLPGRRLLARTISRASLWVMVHDLVPDLRIWHHKRYLSHPKLNDKDGRIGRFRAWARQFYPLSPPAIENNPQHDSKRDDKEPITVSTSSDE